MLYCDVLPSPLRLYPPTRLCQDENLLVSQLCRLSNKKKKADETSKKNYLRKILLVVSCNY